jgi:hypothetical protein
MSQLLLAVAVFLGAATAPPTDNPVDEVLSATWRARGVVAAQPCSDETFVRRVYLDVIGTLPEPGEVAAFLQDPRPEKRAALIDALLLRAEFADYWSMKWCDLLRVKSEFPINLWPNAVQAYQRWITDALRENRPYDQLARELLTSSGSNVRVPPVNFYRAVQGRTAEDLAGTVALTFLGLRIEKLPPERAAGLSACFSRVAFKVTSEWKEEIVMLDPAPVESRRVILPDGSSVLLRPEADPRQVFANWLVTGENPWFARNVVNRIWAWLMGRGIVHEPDDLRADNPPSVPQLLTRLERELVRAHWDLRQVYRLILNSRAYQQSSIPSGENAAADGLFAHYLVRRLEAEVLMDALCGITGTHEEYSSPIPEPFTFLPEEHRTIVLPDGSITSAFLELFGRPARDTGRFTERNDEFTDAQRLYLLNSSAMQRRIESGPRLRALAQAAQGDADALIGSLYRLILSRNATPEEVLSAKQYARTNKLGRKQAADDLAWALINTKEFLYRH